MRVLILGAGFAGSYVARLLGKRAPELEVTLVDPRNYMLYTPLLPEAASGTVEPRHAVVPVRVMCPKARLLLGRATAVDMATRTVAVQPAEGEPFEEGFDTLVVALGAIARTAPVPGLVEHAVGFKTIAEAIHLRNHVLQQLELASTVDDPAERRRRLTFVFVGGGYAGVEAMAELEDLVRDASRHYPSVRNVPRRWILADAADHILNDLRGRLGEYAADQLEKRGFDLRLNTVLRAVDADGVELSDGEHVPTATIVWTAGVRPNPLVAQLGMPLDERSRIVVDEHLQAGEGVWALGDSAAVPNAAAGGATDPPTCQHALRQARTLARNIAAAAHGEKLRTYRYRMLGQAATLGRHKGVFEALGAFRFRGFPGWWLTRTYHLYQLPLMSRRTRVVSDWTVGLFFRRDVVELGSLGRPEPLEPPAR
ncbi:MAG TPA: NAD(P)/FAD-dependent oxidoreductase [Gaiellales bacterium]|nr:NAD(P)/FAD-dependent oxidoreductase [Gaiellales bacterium]